MTQTPQDWQPGPQDAPAWGPSQPGAAASGSPYPPPLAEPYGPPASDHPQAVLAFVLGIMSVVGLAFLGPVAWVVGRNVLRDIDAQPGAYRNRGVAQAGMIMGIVGTCFLALAVMAVTALVLAFLALTGAA